jgi:Methylamine utilisation protein MauE
MVETITPVVHGGSRAKWAVAVALHALAATLVAGAFGAALGAAGGALGAPWGSGGALLVALAAAWASARELLGVPFPVPQLRRQVPDWWRTFFPPIASATLYGGALGIGFLTYLLHATLVVVAIAAFASGRALEGALLVAPFGLARGAAAVAAVRGPDVVHGLASFARRRWPLAAVNGAAVAAVGVTTWSSVRGAVAVRPLALAVLAVAFGWAAVWKLLRPAAWRAVAGGYRLGRLATAAEVGVPFAEGMVAVLAVAGAARPSSVLSLVLLVSFTTAAIRRRVSAPGRFPCGCFGASEISLRALLVRNAVLAVVAVVAAGGADPRPRTPVAADAVPLMLSFVGVVGVVVATRSVRRSLAASRA